MSKHRPISLNELERVGADLHRPECVVAEASGEIFVPDWRGGVTCIGPNGLQETWLARAPALELRPNGVAVLADGSFLLANLSDAGGVWRLQRDGTLEPFLVEIAGAPLPPANFVTVDNQRRVWISVSTRLVPRQQAWRPDFADGFVVLVDDSGARIVADSLHYTNEVRVDPTGAFLYVVETFGRRLTRFRIRSDGSLGDRATALALGHGCFPDGFTFDEAEGIWVTSLISNRLLRVQDGVVETVLEDVNPEFVDDVERAFARGEMRKAHLGPIPETMLQQLTSIAFGGRDKRTIYLGSLHASCVYSFRADVKGM